jgi:DMSO reductase anchor subunit
MAREWPLVAFTLLGQMAAGLLVVAAGAVFFGGLNLDGTAGTKPLVTPSAAALGLMLLALLLSLFHLRHPVRAHRVLSNLRTSWLSREILSGLVFLAALAALVLFCRLDAGRTGLVRGLLAATAAAGLFLILAMARLYMLPAMPGWNRVYTPVSFALSSLALGAASAPLAFGLPTGASELDGSHFAGAAIVFLVGSAVWAFLMSPRFGVLAGGSTASLRPPGGGRRVLHVFRLILLLAAAGASAASLLARGAGDPAGSAGPLAVALISGAALLALAGEVLGRFLFYGSIP